ncbi:MAG TPA: MFS transporter [Streptosporangiaceae bacterium]|jgi:EmrB/QacA subfamily drug resistance transporter
MAGEDAVGRPGSLAPAVAVPAGGAAGPAAPWAALLVMVTAAFMDLLDGTIMQVALPAVQRGMHISDAGLQWTAASYTLAFALALITSARLGDIVGRKRVFLAGLAGFVSSSALVAAASSAGMLIGFRAVQGVAAALMIPHVLAFIQADFGPAARPKAFALYGMVLALAGASGPLAGGLLIQANLAGWGWRTIFVVNIPIGLAALAAGARLIPPSRRSRTARLDPVGLLLATAGLLAVFYPLIEGRQQGWPGWTFASLTAAVPLLGGLVLRQARQARNGAQPLADPSLFASRDTGIGLLVALLFFGATSFFFVLTLFLQFGLGYSPLAAGLSFLPFSLGIVAGSGGAAPLGQKFGGRAVTAGAVVMTLVLLSMIAVIRLAAGQLHGWQLAPSLAVAGLAFGVVSGTLAGVVLGRVPRARAGAASGVVSTVVQLGSVTAIAVAGAVFFSLLGKRPDLASYVHATTGGLAYLAAACAAAAILSLCLRHPPGPARRPGRRYRC